MKDKRNTHRVKRHIREESMSAIRLMYICESDIDLIEKLSLYLDLCQIIEQDKDINSLNSEYGSPLIVITLLFVIANV